MGRKALNADDGKRATLASSLSEQLRDEIVEGALSPGEKLRIDVLKQRYGIGSSPIREALNRLSMESLVLQIDQRGFMVAPISLHDIDELTETRCALYELLLPRSLEFGDDKWEEGIVLSLHRLGRAQWTIGDPPRVNPAARQAHRDFHRSLISACRLPSLINFMDTLFDSADRYRIFSQRARQAPSRAIFAEHEGLANAAIARDSERAVKLAQQHVRRTTEFVHSCIGESRD